MHAGAGEIERRQREGAVAPERDVRHRERVGERVLRRAADELDDRGRRRHGESAQPGGLGNGAVAEIRRRVLRGVGGEIKPVHHRGERWFTAPAPVVNGLYFPGYTTRTRRRTSATAPSPRPPGSAASRWRRRRRSSGSSAARRRTRSPTRCAMTHITLGRNAAFTLPALDFAGTPAGIDARRVVDSGIAAGHQHRHRAPRGRRRPDRRRRSRARRSPASRQARRWRWRSASADDREASMSREHCAVVAIGGNALILDGKHELDRRPVRRRSCELAAHIVDMIEAAGGSWSRTATARRSASSCAARSSSIAEVPPVPMDYAGADTQGAIGYMFLKALAQRVQAPRGIRREPACVVTQTLVDRDDPAFANPTKPIGSLHGRRRAQSSSRRSGWTVREDCRPRLAARGAPRRSRGAIVETRRSSRRSSHARLRGRRLRRRRHPGRSRTRTASCAASRR